MKNSLVAFVVMLFSYVAYANNIESWNMIQSSIAYDVFEVGISEELRIGTDQHQTTKKIDEIHTTAFVEFAIVKWLSLGIQDDYVLLRDRSDARYARDNRPGVNVTLKHSFCEFDMLNRSRIVMRDLEDECPYVRYRNLSKIIAPSLYESRYMRSVRPFVAYEWYFDEGSKDRHIRKNDKFGQFWVDFGIKVKLYDAATVDLFYRLVEVKSAIEHDWSPGHVIGTCISFKF